MRILESFVASPLAGAIGWTLLHSLWEGAAISAILAMVLISTRSPRVRYAAACAAMLAMIAALGITLFRLMPDAAQNFPRFRTFGSLPPLLAFAHQATAGHSWLTDLSTLAPWLAPLWIVGAFAVSLQRVTSWLAAQTLHRRGVCFASEEWHAELARFAMRLRVSRPIHLLESCFAEVPMVLGHLRPVVLMPIGLFANLPPEQIETILLHELAHIRRCDYLVNVLQRFVEGLLFYHPAIWWISKIMRTERENCCDDVVISVSERSHEYALALAAVERHRLSRSEAAVAATGGSLVKRIRRLLYPKAPPSIWAPALAAAILAITAAVSIAAAKAKPNQLSSLPQNTAQARTLSVAHLAARPSADAEPSQTAAAQIDSYSKWLDEDVVYIITPEERDTFLHLGTDEERVQFIKAFWERRNPTPGSADNAYKDEIYRRIDYTNQHFTTSSTPGWKTDRGRIYIMRGKPDDVESHKAGETWNRPMDLGGGTATTYAYEDWRYSNLVAFDGERQQRVIFEFVDATGTGDFHLAMSPNEKDAEPSPNGRSQETSPSNPSRRIVTRIYFSGNHHVDRDTVLSKIETRIGDAYNEETLASDLQALYSTHLFSDVRMEKSDDPTNPNGIVVTFHLTELPSAVRSDSGATNSSPNGPGAQQANDGKVVRKFILPDRVTAEQIAQIVSEMLKGLGGRVEISTAEHAIIAHGTPDDVWLAGKLMLQAADKLDSGAFDARTNVQVLRSQLDEVDTSLARTQQDKKFAENMLQQQLAAHPTANGQNPAADSSAIVALRRQINNLEQQSGEDARELDDLKNQIKHYEGGLQQPPQNLHPTN